MIAEEMDFHHEAENVERFAEIFRDSDFVIIPKVYREVTTTRVLVMQFFEGFRVDRSAGDQAPQYRYRADDRKPD